MAEFKWPLPMTCPFCIDRTFQGITTIVTAFADATASYTMIIVLVVVFELTRIYDVTKRILKKYIDSTLSKGRFAKPQSQMWSVRRYP